MMAAVGMNEPRYKTDLHVLAAWLRNRGLRVELDAHVLLKKHGNSEELRELTGPHQLHIDGPAGRISVCRGGITFGDFEIYSLKGELFEDVHRFKNVKAAGEAIHELLTTGKCEELTDA